MDKSTRELSTYRILTIIVLLAAFALRSYSLDGRSLWFDEAMEYWVASAAIPELLPTVKAALQDPPLYSILLHFWLNVSHTEFAIRYLSLIISMAGMLGVIVLTQLYFGRWSGLVAGVLVAVAIPDIRFAQEAGQYALMSSVLAWNLVFLARLTKDGKWQWAALWGLTCVIVIYSYYGAALVVGATALVAFVTASVQRQWSQVLKVVVAGGLSALLILPLVLAWLPEQLFRGNTTAAFQFSIDSWQTEWLRFITQVKGLFVFQLLGYQTNGWPWPALGEWIIWLPVAFVLLICALRYRLRAPLLWLVTAVLFYYAVGRLGAYPFGGRYSLILAPLFWSCLAAGIAGLLAPQHVGAGQRLMRSLLAGTALALFVAFAFLAPVEAQQDLRSVSQLWLAHRQVDEATYVYYGAVPGFRYQLELAGSAEPAPPLWYRHCWLGEPAPYCAEAGVLYGRWLRQLTPEEKRAAILAAIGPATNRFWIVFSHVYPGEDETILNSLQDTYQIVTRYTTVNAALVLLERLAPSG